MFITKIDGKIIPQRVLIEKSCTPLDVPMIVNFQKEIVDTINGHEIRGMYSHEYFLQTLHRGGNITLLYDNTTFVGFYMLIVNDCEEFEKHGVSILSSTETAIYGGVMLSPHYRGNGLQLQITAALEKLAKQKGYIYIFYELFPQKTPTAIITSGNPDTKS